MRSRGDAHDEDTLRAGGNIRCIVSEAPNGNAFRVLSELSQWTRKTTALITWGVAAIQFKFETCLGNLTANAANFKLC